VTSIDLLKPGDAMVLKELRLRALLEDPGAFSSSFEKESRWSDGEWQEKAAQWCGGDSVTFVASEASRACGLVGAFVDPEDCAAAHLVSMWVAAGSRRRGIGAMLVAAVVDWARARGTEELRLLVTSNNAAAIAFYRKLGFELAGTSGPHANDPAFTDERMIRRLNR
jgi:ribosomal protein S18 acetylase RimI-like enzyme